MKWQWRTLWLVIIVLIIFSVWIMSFPFSESDANQLRMENGILNLEKYNFEISGPIALTGEIGYIPNAIIYDDEYFEDVIDDIEYVPVDAFLDEDRYGGRGYGTYVLNLVPPRTMSVLAFELPDISSSYKMWVDGELICTLGRVSSYPDSYEPMTLTKRAIISVSEEPIRIIFQVANYSNHHTGFQDHMILGSTDQIMQRQINSTLREYLIITSALLIGLYHIAISASRPDEKASLHFGLFAIFLALTLSFFGEKSVYNVFPWLAWGTRLQLGFLLSLITFMLMMRYVILLRDYVRDTKIELGIQVLMVFTYIGMAITTGSSIQTMWINLYLSSVLMMAVYVLIQMILQIKNREAGMRFAAAGMFITLVIFSLDLSDLFGEKYSSYGLFILIFTQALALGFRYSESFRKNMELTSELRLNARILEERNVEVELARDKLEILNKELDNKVNERTEDIRLLLDHSGQAFLSINEFSEIQPGYSKLTEIFLGENIRGKNLWDILCEKESENKDLVNQSVGRVLNEFSPLRRKSYLEILPVDFKYNDYDLSVEYKCIKTSFKEQIMVIMTDVTYEKTLRNQLKLEAELKWTTLKIMKNSNEFWHIYDKFEAFILRAAMDMIKSIEDIHELKSKLVKELHYYKGSLSIYGLEKVVESIHDMESDLSDVRIRTRKAVKSVFAGTNAMKCLDSALVEIHESEGVDLYAYREAIIISKDKLHDVSRALKRQFGSTAGEMIQEVYTLNHQPFRRLFDPYIDYVSVLGKNVGKEVNPIQVVGGDFLVDPVVYEGFSRSMVHLFRNIVDHGIEKPEIRHERGKDSAGNIELEISVSNENKQPMIHLAIKDDGGGIDESRLKESVAKYTNLSDSDIESLEHEALLRFIFSPMISTKQNGDIVSGRGMGMTLVLEEISDLGGRILLENEEQLGLSFLIDMPYKF